MHVGLIVYGSLDTMSGGYLYDRKLVAHLRSQGDTVEIIPLPWRNYLLHLTDNLHFHLPPNLDILIEDELNHPSLLTANARPHPYPVISLVHNLRSSERRPAWQNVFYREVEKKYLRSVDGFIFNSTTTREVVQALVGDSQPYVIATPGGDRFGSLTPERVRARAAEPGPLRLLFLANVTPLKGLHVLLEAMAKDFSNQRSAISLDVIGSMTVDPQYAEKMRRFVSANGLSSAVCFHGVFVREALVESIRKFQSLVTPSFY